MKRKKEYLSDEELKLLILEVEQNDMVIAPPDMDERILSGITPEWERKEEGLSEGQRRKEFRHYCFRVWTSVAAAVVMVFLLPEVIRLQPIQDSLRGFSRIRVIEERERVPDEWGVKGKNIFEDLLSGNTIFSQEDRLNLFNGKNGG